MHLDLLKCFIPSWLRKTRNPKLQTHVLTLTPLASAQTTSYNPLLTFKCMQNIIPHKCACARSCEFRKFQPENSDSQVLTFIDLDIVTKVLGNHHLECIKTTENQVLIRIRNTCNTLRTLKSNSS